MSDGPSAQSNLAAARAAHSSDGAPLANAGSDEPRTPNPGRGSLDAAPPLPLRAYLILVTVSGGAFGLYCLWKASMEASPYWLVLALFQVCASYFSVKGPMVAPETAKRRPPQPQVYSWEFFIFTGLFCFSPEVTVVIALVDAAVGAAARFTRFQADRVAFHVASAALWMFLPAKLFYWMVAQEPPLDAAQSGGWLHLFFAVGICASLNWALNTLSLGVVAQATLGIPLWRHIRSRALSWMLTLGAATAAAAVSAVFLDNALLVVFMAAPVILIVLSYSRAYSQRVLALSESREFLQSSLDALSSYIAVLDENGRIVAANQAWLRCPKRLRLFGSWIAVGANYLDVCRGNVVEEVEAARAIADEIDWVIAGRSEGFTLDYCCGPAEPDAWYVVRVSRFRVPEPLRVVVEHQDITDQMLSETRLRESEERYRRFFEDDLTGDFVTDGNGRLTDCNPAFARIFGFESAENAVGVDLTSLCPDAESARQLIDDLRRQGKLEYREMELRSLSGETIHVVANLSALFDEAGRLLEVEGYLFDDTRRKRLELELAEAQKMEAVGQLAGGIAHDFNNLLTVVTGYGEFLHEAFSSHRKLSEEAARILDAAEQAGGLTSKLLAFSRRQVVRPVVLDLNRTVAEVSLMLRRLIGEDIELSTRLAAKRAKVRMDPSQVEQVILNLALNSRDAMPDGGVLQLETCDAEIEDPRGAEAGEGWLCLRVRDSGMGMTPEVRRRAFEPFFTTKEKGKGTGLGLSTVYGIVQQSGGRLEIESEPGAGTCVEVHLPRFASLEAEVRRTAPEERPAGSETILVVEDEEDIRRLIRNVLSSRGYRVLDAGDGLTAMEVLERAEEPVHLLLTDMVMPGMGGWELARKVRQSGRHAAIKLLFISGYPGGKQSLEAAVASGWGAYLPKPFTSETLLAKVREALDS